MCSFVDANKSAYTDYYELIMGNDSKLLNPNGVAIFDNVLFRGDVPRVADGALRSKISTRLHEFNRMVLADERTINMLLPIRDGLLVVQKREVQDVQK